MLLNIAEALTHIIEVAQGLFCGSFGMQRYLHKEQHRSHSQRRRNHVDEKDHLDGSHGEKRAAQHRGQQHDQGLNTPVRAVHLRKLLLWHDLGQHRTYGRCLHCGSQCPYRRDHKQQPHLVIAHQEQQRQNQRRRRDAGVGEDNQHFAAVPVCPYSGKRRQQKRRHKPANNRNRHHEAGLGIQSDIPEDRILNQ
ncbi:hypothetical protein D3C75_730110 [compost metagenome]